MFVTDKLLTRFSVELYRHLVSFLLCRAMSIGRNFHGAQVGRMVELGHCSIHRFATLLIKAKTAGSGGKGKLKAVIFDCS